MKKNGKDHYKIVKEEARVEVGSIKINFDNLFKGNPEITANTNRLINENAELLFSEVKPIIEKTFIGLIDNIVNFVYDNYPLDILFPV